MGLTDPVFNVAPCGRLDCLRKMCLMLWLKWSASTCFGLSGFASTCFVLKQVGFCLNPQLIPLFQTKSNGCFVLFIVVFDGTTAPLPTDLPLWDLPAYLPSVCCCWTCDLGLGYEREKMHTPPNPKKDAVPKRWFVGQSFKEFLNFSPSRSTPNGTTVNG